MRNKANYKKIIEDYKSGELKDWQLVFDNDGGYWNKLNCNEQPSEEQYEEHVKKYGEPSGYKDIVSLALAAGIEADWA
jgi:hypothetical protein